MPDGELVRRGIERHGRRSTADAKRRTEKWVRARLASECEIGVEVVGGTYLEGGEDRGAGDDGDGVDESHGENEDRRGVGMVVGGADSWGGSWGRR